MPSLSANFKIGNASATSLIKSAATVQRELATFKDQQAADTYKYSAHTDADYQAYAKYLNSRISALNATGTITDASKALSMTSTLMSAMSTNISANITRETIDVMNGNASNQDKLNYLTSAYSRALANGDQSLALSLASRADSLSQTIQYQAQTAATARNTLVSTGASEQDHVATTIENGLRQLNTDTGAAGMSALNQKLNDYVKANKQTFLALANNPNIDQASRDAIVKAVNTSQPSYQDIAAGAAAAIGVAHYLAGLAELPVDPAKAQEYFDKQTALANGETKIPSLAGDLTQAQLNQWQQTPGMFIPHENVNSGQLTFSYNDPGAPKGSSSVSGFRVDQSGNVVGSYTGSQTNQPLTSSQADQVNAALKKMGVGFTQVKAGQSIDHGISVQFNAVTADGKKAPAWANQITGGQQNVVLQAIPTAQGVQIASLDATGKANVYLVATDSTGKHAVYKMTGRFSDGNPIFGKQVAQGEYGFNQANNSLWHTPGQLPSATKGLTNGQLNEANKQTSGSAFGLSNLKNNIYSWLGLGHSDLNQLISNAQGAVAQMHAKLTAANPTVAAQLTLPSLRPVPPLSMTSPPPQAPPPQMAPVLQPTVNPQANNVNPQPHTTNPQQTAGGFNLNQSGSGGIQLNMSAPRGIPL